MSSLLGVTLLLFGSLVGLEAFQVDKKIYCNLPYCGTENIVCQKANYSFLCKPKTRLVDLNAQQKGAILGTVNTFRNRAAKGLTRTLLPAGRMARISWSKELEHFAMVDVMSCMPTPRPCMTSPNFPNMGSIFDTHGYRGSKQDITKIITDMILEWTKDARYVTRQQTLLLTDRSDQRSVFRPALLMTDRNNFMGCAAVTFTFQRFNYVYLSCTFATVNVLGSPIYRPAKTPARFCQIKDYDFRYLCSVDEKYPENLKRVDLNKYMT